MTLDVLMVVWIILFVWFYRVIESVQTPGTGPWPMTTDVSPLMRPPSAWTCNNRFKSNIERVRVCGFARRSCQENRITRNMKDKVSKDPLIERIGTHGKFQLRAFLIIQFVGVFAGWQLLVSYMSRTCPSQKKFNNHHQFSQGRKLLPSRDWLLVQPCWPGTGQRAETGDKH